jgi:hypothetical protein
MQRFNASAELLTITSKILYSTVQVYRYNKGVAVIFEKGF